jgi:hypothetical protein
MSPFQLSTEDKKGFGSYKRTQNMNSVTAETQTKDIVNKEKFNCQGISSNSVESENSFETRGDKKIKFRNVTNVLKQKCIFTAVLILIGLAQINFGQTIHQTQYKADQILRGGGRVNPSTLGMEFSTPLGGYPGRAGNDKQLTLNYSSKVWGTDLPDTWEYYPGEFLTDLRPIFGKQSVKGWTTPLDIPRIEIPGDDSYYHPHNGNEGQLWGGEQYVTPYKIKRIKVIMPNGSAHEMRQDDNLYSCTPGTFFDWTGTYLSVDGSRMRLDIGNSQTVLYFPDGGRIFFDSNYEASSFIDPSGNKMTYAPSTKQWTDTLGRVLTNPFPTTRGELGSFQPAEGTQVYQFPGFNGQNQQVEFVWAKLGTQHSSLAYTTSSGCLTTQKTIPSGATLLFSAGGNDSRACDATTTPLNPVVLTEVHLQNGSSYKFHYNLYGEIDKIEYPTGGYERFEYGQITALQPTRDPGYDLFNRGVKKRWVSSDGTTTTEVLWKYDVTRANQACRPIITLITRLKLPRRMTLAPNNICLPKILITTSPMRLAISRLDILTMKELIRQRVSYSEES